MTISGPAPTPDQPAPSRTLRSSGFGPAESRRWSQGVGKVGIRGKDLRRAGCDLGRAGTGSGRRMKVLTLDPLDDVGLVGVDLHRPRLLGPAAGARARESLQPLGQPLLDAGLRVPCGGAERTAFKPFTTPVTAGQRAGGDYRPATSTVGSSPPTTAASRGPAGVGRCCPSSHRPQRRHGFHRTHADLRPRQGRRPPLAGVPQVDMA